MEPTDLNTKQTHQNVNTNTNTDDSESDCERSESEAEYNTVKRSKRRRKSINTLEDSNQLTQQMPTQRRNKTMRTVYVIGQCYNLAKSLELRSIRGFKQSIVEIIGEPELIDCKGDTVRIVCRSEREKSILLKQTEIDGRKVIISLPYRYTSFWKAWRKRFCIRNLKTAGVVNGASGDENILDEFSKHFSRVGEPNTANANRKHEKAVLDFLSTYDSASVDSVRVIDVQLLHECVRNLKLHKAAAHDGIYNEHVIFAGPPVSYTHLTLPTIYSV